MSHNVTDLSPKQNQAIDFLMAEHTPCNIPAKFAWTIA